MTMMKPQSLLTPIMVAALGLAFSAVLLAVDSASDPAEAARLNNLGAAYMNQQLFEKALKAFEAAATKDPTLKVAALNCGIALLNLQKLDEAKPVLEKAVKDDPAMLTRGSTSGCISEMPATRRRRWKTPGGLLKLMLMTLTAGIFSDRPMRR